MQTNQPDNKLLENINILNSEFREQFKTLCKEYIPAEQKVDPSWNEAAADALYKINICLLLEEIPPEELFVDISLEKLRRFVRFHDIIDESRQNVAVLAILAECFK